MRRLPIPFIVAAVFAVPAVASAHTPAVADSCHNLTVTLTNYEGDTPNNRVIVTIDGATQTFDYGTSFARTFGWAPTAAHTWTVSIDANRVHGHPTEFDRTFNGTEQPCQTTTTSPLIGTSTSTTTTSPPIATTTTLPTTTTTTAPSSTSSQPPPSSTSEPGPSTSIPTSSTVSSPTSTSLATADSTSPTAPPEKLDNLPVTGGSTIDPWWIIPPIALGLYALLAARRPRTP